MKKYQLLTLVAVLVSAGYVMAQNREVREVENFSKISFGFPGKLYLQQGSPQKVELQGDPDVLEEVQTEVDGGRLKIGKEGKWFKWDDDDKITVYITVPNIEGVSVSGSGDIIGQSKIRTNDLEANVSGSGSMTLDVEANGEVDAKVSGSGNLTLKGHFESLESDVSGSGRVVLDARIDDEADFGISGSGKIEARGQAESVKANISGSGKVLAADLETDRCEVRISGSGDVEINVVNELDANISGSGSVSYRGSPKKINSNASGSGKVRKI
ncbi:MAG TPA: head GIN domain-containing protein [Chryseosolibacter sp.]|nr:head GIN domain-containing protein [Chryseosolibacter sp.]